MYTDEQLEELETEERVITDEAIAVMISILAGLSKDLENELRKFYQEYGDDGKITYSEARKWVSEKDHRRRLFVLFAAMDGHFKKSLNELEIEFEKLLNEITKLESDFFGVEVDYDKILKQTWGNDQSTWVDRLQEDYTDYEARLFSELKSNMVRNDSITDVIDMLDKVFGTYSNSTERLVITESTVIGSFARKAIMKFKGAKKYRFYAREDERTCEHCGALHGKVFPISQFEIGVTASPIHPRCRCWEVPIINED